MGVQNVQIERATYHNTVLAVSASEHANASFWGVVKPRRCPQGLAP